MNSCILMAEIIQDPQLRYTSDNLEITEMLVQFPGLKEGDPVQTLKVIAWRNMATEIKQKYKVGDCVIVEGRLGMNTITRPEGFKEKRAELTIQRIQLLNGSLNMTAPPAMAAYQSAPVMSPPMKDSFDYNSTPVSTPAPKAPPAAVTTYTQEEEYTSVPTSTSQRSYEPTTSRRSYEPTTTADYEQGEDLEDIPF